MELIWIFSYLALGAMVGVLAGLLGIGGGGLMVPVLTSMFLIQGIEVDKVVHLALGTSMASIVVTSFASMRAHNRKQAVLWDIVKSMSPGIILGTFVATFIVAKASSIYLAGFFSLFMGYVSLQMFLNKKPKPSREQVGNGAMFGAGTGIGAISALVSIGGGSLTVPFLVWQNIDMKKAIGTSAAVGLPISMAGTLGYVINGWSLASAQDYSFGFVYLPAVLLISLCSYLTAPLGAALAHSLPVHALKKVFAVLLLGLSLKMLFSVI